jgi:hypothetical protein
MTTLSPSLDSRVSFTSRTVTFFGIAASISAGASTLSAGLMRTPSGENVAVCPREEQPMHSSRNNAQHRIIII